MFRAGRVYAVDPQDRARLKALKSLAEAKVPAAETVTAAQAEKLGLQVITLEAPAPEGEADQAKGDKAPADKAAAEKVGK